MSGSVEDEAITVTFNLSMKIIESFAEVMSMALTWAADGGPSKLADVAAAPARAVAGAADGYAVSDGRGSKGFINAKNIDGDFTTLDLEGLFDVDAEGCFTEKGRRQYAAVRKELRRMGVGVAISRDLPGKGDIRMSFDAADAERLRYAFLNAGCLLVDEKLAKPEEFPFKRPGAGEPAGALPAIERDEGGSYPTEFTYLGYDFSRLEDGSATWRASLPDDPRYHLTLSLEGENEASWAIDRSGEPLGEGYRGSVVRAEDGEADPRCSYFKRGAAAVEMDDEGHVQPVFREWPDGEPVLDAEGRRVQAYEKVSCEKDDPACCLIEYAAGGDVPPGAPKGRVLEAAIVNGNFAMTQSHIDENERVRAARDVEDASKAVVALGKGGGARGRASEPDLSPTQRGEIAAAKLAKRSAENSRTARAAARREGGRAR